MVKDVLNVIEELIVERRFPQTVILLANRLEALEDASYNIALKLQSSFRKLDISPSNIHLDLYRYYPEGKINLHSIDAMRSLSKKVWERPFESEIKVFIIHAVDRMSLVVASTLLKTLEEPPSDTVFILTSNRKKNIPEVVLSRCKVFFIPINKDYFSEFIKKSSFFEEFLSLDTSAIFSINERLNTSIFGKSKSDKEEVGNILNFILLCYRDRYLLEHQILDYLTFPEHSKIIRKLPNLPLNRVMDVLTKSYEALEKGSNKSFCLEWALLELETLASMYGSVHR